MKILYSCLSKSWGGMEMVAVNSIKQLIARGIQVELLCIEESRIHIEANALGILILPVKASGFLHPFTTLKIASHLRKDRFDLIHTHASTDLWVLVPSLKLVSKKTPLLLTKHVGSFILKKDFFHNILYKRVDYALAISNVIKKNLLETTSLTEDKIIIHYNGIDVNRFNPDSVDREKVRKELLINNDELLLGMTARFSKGKGHEEFLAAAEKLNKRFNNLKFVIVGEASRGENNYEEKIKKLAGEKNFDNIIFTGYRSDIPELLAAMDIFVFPSHSEAFGIALVEAMAMSRASVCTNSDGILDIAVDGKTSFLFERKNPDDLFEKLSKLIENSDIRRNFGAESRKRVVELFNQETQTSKLIDLYKRVIDIKQ